MADISRLVFSLSKLGIKALERLFKASVRVHGAENIPDGVSILAVNHFTRLETLILPTTICSPDLSGVIWMVWVRFPPRILTVTRLSFALC
jgi:1-acyl-sn-glycerol-3-phosphate acyltransferase